MRVLIIHTYYLQPGGEDVVAEGEAALLRSRGHDVKLLTRSNADILKLGKLGAAGRLLSAIWSRRAVRGVVEEARRFAPDVVHIHNLWYQLNPALITELKAGGAKVVMTLHNFRLTCVNGLLFRRGRICTRCVGRTGLWGVYHACYRGSRLQSLCAYLMAKAGRMSGAWNEGVDAFICMTDFSQEMFVKAGLPPGKLFVKPHFMASPDDRGPIPKDAVPTAVFVGRRSAEKGFPFLASAWRRRRELLKVIGTGDAGEPGANVEFRGHLAREGTLEQVARSWVLVAPSLCHETFGLTLIEAFMMGTPVLASANGTFESLITHGRNGMIFRLGDEEDFHAKLDELMGDRGLRERIAVNAREDFDRKYRSGPGYDRLMQVYRAAGAA